MKIEGGASRVELVERLTSAEIPVIGHLGLTPQSVNRMGGYKVQGKLIAAINELLHDAHALESAGAVLLVLEGMPREVAARITAEVGIPTIGSAPAPTATGRSWSSTTL